jgi:hypothetical protein
LGIIFKPNGEFNRTDQIKYYENEPLKRRPDNLRGTWRIETVGSHIYLYMVFNKKRHIKFDILKLNDYWLKIKVLQIT